VGFSVFGREYINSHIDLFKWVKKGLPVFVHDGSLYEFNWLETANVVHIWSCLCGLYELVCRASLRLYCNWSSSRGDSVDERVNHCSYNCEPLSIKSLNPLLYCWLFLKWDLVDVFIFFLFMYGYMLCDSVYELYLICREVVPGCLK
jgi:hypothetical protein